MPSIERFEPWEITHEWVHELIIAQTDTYLGKILTYKPGDKPALQYHEHKDESFYLVSGEGWVDYDAGDGNLTRIQMFPGMAFRVPPGAVHSFTALTNCVVFEVSTPHFDDRVRVEGQYGRRDA